MSESVSIGYRKWVLALILVADAAFVALGLFLVVSLFLPGTSGKNYLFISLFGLFFASIPLLHGYTVAREYLRKGPAITIDEFGITLYRANPEMIPWHLIQGVHLFTPLKGSRFILLKGPGIKDYHRPPYLPLRLAKALSLTGGIKMYLDAVAASNGEIRDLINRYKPEGKDYSL